MPQSPNLFLVFCIIHSTLIVISHKSELNYLSSVAEILFVLLLLKVLLCNSNTSTKVEFGQQASSVNYGTPMISLSAKLIGYKKKINNKK
jgi:hypothetical protein